MNFTKIFFFFFSCFAALSLASAAPENFFKEIERAVARTRDAIISAAPAGAVVSDATKLVRQCSTSTKNRRV